MGVTPVVPVQDLKTADIEKDVRTQMNKELDETATPVQRSALMQKYGLTVPILTPLERADIEAERQELKARRRQSATRD